VYGLLEKATIGWNTYLDGTQLFACPVCVLCVSQPSQHVLVGCSISGGTKFSQMHKAYIKQLK